MMETFGVPGQEVRVQVGRNGDDEVHGRCLQSFLGVLVLSVGVQAESSKRAEAWYGGACSDLFEWRSTELGAGRNN